MVRLCDFSIYNFLKHHPPGPLLSISRFVHMCVCLSVCLSVCSLLRYHLNLYFPPFPVVVCPKFLEIQNFLGKSNRKKWSHITKLLLIKSVKSPRTKKFFLGEFRYK